MQTMRSDVMSRLGGIGNQSSQRFPRVEFVNRAGERVDPHNGKPYSRPLPPLMTTTNGIPKKKKNKKKKIIAPGRNNKYPVKTTGIMFGGLNLIPTIPMLDPPPHVCFNCWQHGHSKKKCPRPVVTKMCDNCGRRGEDLNTCPRCKEAHMRYLAHVRGEKLNDNDLEQLFPQGYQFENEGMYNEAGPLDDGIDETIQQLIEQEERERELNSYYDEHEKEVAYSEPQVKYVETREYVKNPVSRYREYEEDEVLHRHHKDYDYGDREGSYDERRDREKFPRYREREPSEDRPVERIRRDENSSNADLDADPVKEILQLAKSIAHLSPETQELVMKQVIAERQEKARLRAMTMQDRVVDEDWP